MSYVEKVLIKGIRSFDPENTSPFVLYKPLTLIVGSNGAGKTTVIEALRVACTGTLPPNARLGQSFVHDPKIAKQREVKAQIMVRFCNTAGDPFMVIRSYQLSQKATSMQFKAIDQTLKKVDPRTNEKVVITQTCADMDKIVPTMLGVSKAVLDNVIFVHQDESNWPLAEPKVLKEKFDLLFGTSAYSKWFEEIRKLKTEKANELKVKKVDLGHLKTHQTHAVKLKTQIENMKQEITTIQQEIDERDIKIRIILREVEDLESDLQQLGEKETELFVLRSKIKTVEHVNADLYESLPDGDFEEDDAGLHGAMEECDATVTSTRRGIEELDSEAVTLQGRVAILKEQYSTACQTQGRLEAETAAYERDVEERDAFLRKLTGEYDLSSGASQIHSRTGDIYGSGLDVEAFLSAFEEIVLERESDLESMTSRHKEAEAKLNEDWRQLKIRIETLTETQRFRKQDRGQNDLKRKQLKTKAIEIVIDDADLEELEMKEREILGMMEANQKSSATRDFQKLIEFEKTEIDRCILQIKNLKEECGQVRAASETDTKIRLKKKEIACKSEQISTLLSQNPAKMRELLGQVPGAKELMEVYSMTWSRLQEQVTQTEDRLRRAQSAQSLSQSERDLTRNDVKNKEQKSVELRQKLKLAMPDDEVDAFEQIFSHYEHESNELREATSLEDASVRLLKTYIKTAQSDSLCPMCDRSFTRSEKESFVASQKHVLESAPSEIAARKAKLETLENRISDMKQLQPLWIQYSILQNDTLCVARSRLKEIESASSDHIAKVQEAKNLYEAVQIRMKEMKGLKEEVVWRVRSLLQDVELAVEEIEMLTKESLESHGSRSMVMVEEDLQKLESEKSKHEARKDSLQKEQQQLSSCFVTLLQTHLKIKGEIEKYRTASANSEVYQTQVTEIEEKMAALDNQLKEIDVELQTLLPEKERVGKLKVEERAAAVSQEQQLEKQAKESRQQLELALRKILIVNDFQSSKTVAKDLEKSRQQLKDLEEEQGKLDERINSVEKTRREHGEDIQKLYTYRRSVEDCMKWREGKRREEGMKAEVSVMEQEISSMESKAAMTRKLRKLQKDMEQTKDSKSRSAGSLITLQRSLSTAKEELQSDLYGAIDRKYKAAMVDKVLLEMGIDDLMAFHKACEKALIVYHSMKMEEINASMKELWRNIYKGTDIEAVQIKAEEVKGHAGRSHNYRLSMYVNGSELEMRGRCSAGQKVLAGIIVRLALADTFCVKCGILALDEPTTNLDAANVESLAEALREVIENRQHQKNFQLIVITHDDQFARSLRLREHAEFMWRVTKNERNHSVVTRERI